MPTLCENFLVLMEKKAEQVKATPRAERELIELGEVLRHSVSELRALDREIAVRKLNEMASRLDSSDERNAKTYLEELARTIGSADRTAERPHKE